MASNPFARPTNGKVAQATKSKSFFERVDDIQAKGKVNGRKLKRCSSSRYACGVSPFRTCNTEAAIGKQHKQPSNKDKTTTKQATLFSLKGAPSKEIVIDKSKPSAVATVPEEVLQPDQSEVHDLEAEESQAELPLPEEDLEETQIDETPQPITEETQIDETPQPLTEEPEAMDDDEEPLEWEESDKEDA